jgi:archaeosine-15-forming tRNA-guanine transglycosylase
MPHLSKTDKKAKVSATEADRRKTVALAELRELELAQKRGALLPAAEVRKVWAERLAALKDRVLMLPDRLAARLANRPEPEVRVVLRDEIEECLRGIHADAQ